MPAVFRLVQALADYEKAPHEVLTSPDEYLADYEAGRFECLVAEHAAEVIGMALFFNAYSTWKGKMLYLDDLVVAQEYRGKGVGQALYDAFITLASERGCRLAKWQVLEWNTPAVRFYERNGAIIETDWWNVKRLL
ncbi:MAG: GNAT family N-acetyltransferase [Saprospiraceae bacterium]